jgi:hypothetical protein
MLVLQWRPPLSLDQLASFENFAQASIDASGANAVVDGHDIGPSVSNIFTVA